MYEKKEDTYSFPNGRKENGGKKGIEGDSVRERNRERGASSLSLLYRRMSTPTIRPSPSRLGHSFAPLCVGRALEEAEKADNYFHAAARACTCIERAVACLAGPPTVPQIPIITGRRVRCLQKRTPWPQPRFLAAERRENTATVSSRDKGAPRRTTVKHLWTGWVGNQRREKNDEMGR